MEPPAPAPTPVQTPAQPQSVGAALGGLVGEVASVPLKPMVGAARGWLQSAEKAPLLTSLLTTGAGYGIGAGYGALKDWWTGSRRSSVSESARKGAILAGLSSLPFAYAMNYGARPEEGPFTTDIRGPKSPMQGPAAPLWRGKSAPTDVKPFSKWWGNSVPTQVTPFTKENSAKTAYMAGGPISAQLRAKISQDMTMSFLERQHVQSTVDRLPAHQQSGLMSALSGVTGGAIGLIVARYLMKLGFAGQLLASILGIGGGISLHNNLTGANEQSFTY